MQKTLNQSNVLPIYSLWIVIKDETSEKINSQLYEYIIKLIAESGGSISFPKSQGKKYTLFTKAIIRKQKIGKYISFDFTSSPKVLPWLSSFLTLSDRIIRFMIIQK